MNNKLLGKKVIIKAKGSMYYNEWGTIKYIDDDNLYHIAIAKGIECIPIFDRKEFTIVKNQNRFEEVKNA